MAELLAMEAVSRYYRAGGLRCSAVRGVNLELAEGELVAIVGRSGSGKTTLLGLAGGLDRPDEGHVRVAGQELASLSAARLDEFRRRTVGWVFQASGLLPLLTAVENVALVLQIQGVAERRSEEMARAALDEMGMLERAGHRAYELSGGEQQRVALARALVKHPRVVLADEPTGQLDSETSTEVMALLRKAAGTGITVLVATHDAAVVDIADRVLRMEDGSVSA